MSVEMFLDGEHLMNIFEFEVRAIYQTGDRHLYVSHFEQEPLNYTEPSGDGVSYLVSLVEKSLAEPIAPDITALLRGKLGPGIENENDAAHQAGSLVPLEQ